MLKFILFFLFISLTLEQQQCPVGQVSFDRRKFYFAISSTRSYSEAESDCQTRAAQVGLSRSNAFLVSISSTFDNIFVLAAATSDTTCDEYFIGLTRNTANSSWQWSDGTPFSYTHWNIGCPTSNSDDRCVTSTSGGLWCNRNCATRYCYICQTIINNATIASN